MKICVPGGCGYIGSTLVPFLLSQDHEVTVVDTQWFGKGYLPDNENLTVIKGDISDASGTYDSVIYLAGLTSDSACRDYPEAAKKANSLSFNTFVPKVPARRFVFMSSVAVYGNGLNLDVHSSLRPTTPYGEFKKQCEEDLSGLDAIIIRSAGVVGYAPRMRFDLTLNRMVRDAFNGKITVNGGEQYRPHVHIRDLVDNLIKAATGKLKPGVYNLVRENMTVSHSAMLVSKHVPCEVKFTERTDNRSYSVKSNLPATRDLEEAIIDLHARFKEGYWINPHDPQYMNLPKKEDMEAYA